jgi:hypothetical protein
LVFVLGKKTTSYSAMKKDPKALSPPSSHNLQNQKQKLKEKKGAFCEL